MAVALHTSVPAMTCCCKALSTRSACDWLQSRFGLVPLVSLINKYEGKPIYSLGGAAVALASRNDLQTLQDIRNQRVIACTR